MIIVADTTPLSELAKVGRLELLRDIFGTVIIPQEVYNEVTVGNYPAARLVPVASWIEVQPVGSIQMVQALQVQTDLDLGECAAIVLAQELKAEQLLIDDLDARKLAKSIGLPLIGTVGVLLLAKEKGLIFSVKDVMDELITNGMWISQRLYIEVLAIALEK
ncbi:DUF3368 domain-containing protein [Iningainema tapete]|uniref:DUF3368 domain-containing protein n=1 Tax=Iningainema tapete BLCC-T55 TaxID=2748662 RepID=A0A8J7C946_9CYAN|nr:DUF3368 domain-containing protein [Iningainema tapete BLCC-T55]